MSAHNSIQMTLREVAKGTYLDFNDVYLAMVLSGLIPQISAEDINTADGNRSESILITPRILQDTINALNLRISPYLDETYLI